MRMARTLPVFSNQIATTPLDGSSSPLYISPTFIHSVLRLVFPIETAAVPWAELEQGKFCLDLLFHNQHPCNTHRYLHAT